MLRDTAAAAFRQLIGSMFAGKDFGVLIAMLLALQATHCHALPQLAQLPDRFNDAQQFAASCTRQSSKGLELEHAVLFQERIYCAEGAATVGVSAARLTTPTNAGRSAHQIPHVPVVAADNSSHSLPRTCTYLPEHAAFVGVVYWGQIGHFVYNTVACLFSVLGFVKAHAAGTDAYAEARATLHDSLQLFIYPDIKLDGRWMTSLWQPMLSKASTSAEILGVFTRHPAMSLPALLRSSATQAFCFRKLTLGLSGSMLDHYLRKVPEEHWRIFIDALAAGFDATPIPRCSRAATNVVVVQRKTRRILNPDELAGAVEELFRSSALGQGHVQVVVFEELSFAQQVRLMARTDVMIGVDGTGLFNGNFMPTGSYVLRIKPYALDILIPGKSGNFKRIWQALGIQQLEWGAKYLNQTTPSTGAKHLQALVDAVQRGEKPSRLERFQSALAQDTRVDVVEIQQMLTEVLREIHARNCSESQGRQ
jgi:hypothetical protein